MMLALSVAIIFKCFLGILLVKRLFIFFQIYTLLSCVIRAFCMLVISTDVKIRINHIVGTRRASLFEGCYTLMHYKTRHFTTCSSGGPLTRALHR